jgi:hypothetical protein
MNTNQFLQTARTVSFIIQKNKESIPNFQSWYEDAVITPWGKDEVMRWAKNARNSIEKEGDLELNSSLNLTLLFSYSESDDLQIQCGKAELLNSSVRNLVAFAKKTLPPEVAAAGAIKIERRWVTATLPNWELLHALAYAYARNFKCCQSLARQLNAELDSKIPDPSTFDRVRDDSRKVEYVKLNENGKFTVRTDSLDVDRTFAPSEKVASALKELAATSSSPTNLAETLNLYKNLAEKSFEIWGYQVPLLIMFDKQWTPLKIVSFQPADQTEKFIFWRAMADRASTLMAYGLVWISESWIRSLDRGTRSAVQDLPIVGERLQIYAIDKSCKPQIVSWEILRRSNESRPTLMQVAKAEDSMEDAVPYFLEPILRAINADFSSLERHLGSVRNSNGLPLDEPKSSQAILAEAFPPGPGEERITH